MNKVLILFLFAFRTATAFAQDSTYQQLLDYSRPGSNHLLLAGFAGNWNFKDTERSYVKGTLSRQAIFDGRFYQVVITGGKLPLPISGGKMKEDNYRELQTEGYDNGRRQFVTTAINNHIGSDISMQTGSYDPATKAFTYNFTTELIPGQKQQNQRIVKLTDSDHYTEEFYEMQDGKLVKTRELRYTRAKQGK